MKQAKRNSFLKKYLYLIILFVVLIISLVAVKYQQSFSSSASSDRRSLSCKYMIGEKACKNLIGMGYPCKWDSKSCIAAEGVVPSCKVYQFKKGTVESAFDGKKISGTCDYGIRGFDCVGLVIKKKDGSSTNCRWTGTSGTAKTFICDIPFNSLESASCQTFTGTPMHCCSKTSNF